MTRRRGTHDALTGVVPFGAGGGDVQPWGGWWPRGTVVDVNTSTAIESSGRASTVGLCGPALLAVAADPVRWRVLAALAAGTQCVCKLLPIAGVSAPTLTHHLKALRAAGLATAVRRGKWVDYSLAPDALARLHAALPSPAGAPDGGCCSAEGAA